MISCDFGGFLKPGVGEYGCKCHEFNVVEVGENNQYKYLIYKCKENKIFSIKMRRIKVYLFIY